MSGERDFLNLRRVLIAPAQEDAEVRVLALEVYNTGFVIRYVLTSGRGRRPTTGAEMSLNPMGLSSLTLRDDLSTGYEMFGGSGGSYHRLTFVRPAIPEEAEWLEVLTKGGVVRFELAPG